MNKRIDELIKNPKTIIPMQIETVFEEQKIGH